jgi:hypothetical protein
MRSRTRAQRRRGTGPNRQHGVGPECDNQRALLEGFRRSLSEDHSLVFFYAKQTPLTDSGRRQIVAVAKLSKIGEVDEYPYEGGRAAGRIRSMIWERPFSTHSGRTQRRRCLARRRGPALSPGARSRRDHAGHRSSPVRCGGAGGAYNQFLFGTDHVTHGSAITSLQAVRTALEAAAEHLPGPWARYISWIDRELSHLWVMHGPAPGLAAHSPASIRISTARSSHTPSRRSWRTAPIHGPWSRRSLRGAGRPLQGRLRSHPCKRSVGNISSGPTQPGIA